MTTARANRYPTAPRCGELHPLHDDSLGITLEVASRTGPNHVGRADGERRVALGQAMALGLVNREGYLTPLGYRFWR